VINNRSNVFFAQGKLELSEAYYKSAISLNDKKASFHYNLYRTYIELYKFLEARKKEELVIARRLDQELIDYHLKKIYSPSTYNRMLIDEPLPFNEFWKRVFRNSDGKKMVVDALWPFFFKGIPYSYGIFFFILMSLIIFVLLFQLEAGKNLSTRCLHCGRQMKRRRFWGKGDLVSDFCSHCVDLYLEREKFNVLVTDRKFEEVAKHRKRQNLIWKILTFALPGGGLLWSGFTGTGIVSVFVFFCFIMKFLFWQGFVRDPFLLNYSGSVLKFIIFILLFFLFNYVVIRKSFQKKESSKQKFLKVMEDFRLRSQKQKAQSE
jgi:tetratricopeptide (TPR) repeat protein